MDLSSERSRCSSCGFYYGERQSESYMEETTGTPYTPPQEEKDVAEVLQGMFGRILRDYKQMNRVAEFTLDTMLDELHGLGGRRYIQRIHARHEEDYQARRGLANRER